MQIDFHYYATFALARAAGFRPELASRAALAAQYVDDATEETWSGTAKVPVVVTAHTLWDPRNTAVVRRTALADQERIWVPFHFLPGGQGSTVSEKLVCGMDSPIARQVVQLAVGRIREWYGPELLGVTAHVYADTFSHHGFSGVSSRRNRVDADSIETRKSAASAQGLVAKVVASLEEAGERAGLLPNFRRIAGGVLDTLGALGHGAVATCPDQPYLFWSFEYQGYQGQPSRTSGDRCNPIDFITAAEKLYNMFSAARNLGGPDMTDQGGARPFSEIRSTVSGIVWTVGSVEERCAAWRAAAANGKLYNGGDPIPTYDATVMDRSRTCMCQPSSSERVEPIGRFYRAAGLHRDYVIKVLLPQLGIQFG